MLRTAARAVALLALLALGTSVLAQSVGSYDLTWNTVDGGGAAALPAGGYTLGGTAGQPDAGLLTGGDFTLGGGFWRGGAAAPPGWVVCLPLVLRNW